MRMDSSAPSGAKNRKQVQNASNKISCVVHRFLLPLLSGPIQRRAFFRAVRARFRSSGVPFSA